MSKMNDRYHRNVEEGYQKIIRLYQKIGLCRQKTEGDRLWNELTKSITTFRKSLSKLESYVYEELLNRFEKTTKSDDSARGTDSSCPNSETENCQLFVEEDFPPIGHSAALETAMDKCRLQAGDCWPVAPVPPEDPASRFPLPVYFRLGEVFRVRVLQIVSPLEFYVVRNEDFDRYDEVERVLDACHDELRLNPLTDEFCMAEGACAALVDNQMKRAVIRMKGKEEVQVYLVDLGRTQFLHRTQVFLLPKTVANMAPPLAHYCSLTDVDGRQLDQTTVRRFMEKVVQKGELLLHAYGTRHRLYGELVDILHEKKKSPPSPGMGWSSLIVSSPNNDNFH